MSSNDIFQKKMLKFYFDVLVKGKIFSTKCLYFSGGICGDKIGQIAIITRTNFTLFCEAVNRCSPDVEPGKKLAFAGVFYYYYFTQPARLF